MEKMSQSISQPDCLSYEAVENMYLVISHLLQKGDHTKVSEILDNQVSHKYLLIYHLDYLDDRD
jgi:hypothetical protein